MAKSTDSKNSKTETKKPEPKVPPKTEKTPEQILKDRKHEPQTPSLSKAAKKPAKDESVKSPQAQLDPLRLRGKKYREALKQVDRQKAYSLAEALALLPKTSYVKFDATVECHLPLNIDPKQSDQLVRGTVTLPHGSGKAKRVAALASGDDIKAAQAAGADLAGEDDLLEAIKAGEIDFDILVATPGLMSKLAPHAKELGPRGLMPSPKSGTVAADIGKAVKELKGGRVEFRVDPQGIIHQPIGKLSFTPEQLQANLEALLKAVRTARPASVKGTYLKKVWLSTSMGLSLKVDPKGIK